MIDLHTHTHFSDGSLSPEQLIQRAVANRLTHLAITDHDCTGALENLVDIPEAAALQIIPGVEISTLWQQREIHIVGLFIDKREKTLQDLTRNQQQLRMARIEEFDQRLDKIGIPGLLAYIKTLPCQAAGRNHVADFLIENGKAVDKQQAFKKFLGNTGRVKTAAHWCEIGTAVMAIRSAGGIAVLAHPDRYKYTRNKLNLLLDEFKECGGEGLEVSYSNLSHDQLLRLATVCEQQELWASVGSDFHTPAAGWMDIGRIRQLPQGCRERAIWHHPRWSATSVGAGTAQELN